MQNAEEGWGIKNVQRLAFNVVHHNLKPQTSNSFFKLSNFQTVLPNSQTVPSSPLTVCVLPSKLMPCSSLLSGADGVGNRPAAR
jgi:hypothetical protein